MLEWYKDKEIGIYFSEKPCVIMRYALPSMSAEDKKAIAKYPFENKKHLNVELHDYKKRSIHFFMIPRNYCWDGATIPKAFWRLIGSKTDSKFLIPSMVHDILCEHHDYVNHDRYFCDRVFERLLYVSGVPAFNRWLMFHSVDNFQKFCKWDKSKEFKGEVQA